MPRSERRVWRRLGGFIARRVLLLPLSIFIIVTLTFGLVNILPGNPAVSIAGEFVTEQRLAEIEAQLGLDKPLGTRYVDYLQGLLHGDLGRSFFTGRPIRGELADRFPITFELVVPALMLAALLGLALGSVAAYSRRRAGERVSRAVVTLMQSTPDFVLGLVLIYFVFFRLGWAPSPLGRIGIAEIPAPKVTGFPLLDAAIGGRWSVLTSQLSHMVLPVLTLAIIYAAYFAKISRTALANALNSQQVEFARACGLPEWQVYRYAFVVARTPILTYGGILLGALLGGVAIIESVFSWHGLGEWGLEAITSLDMPAIQGFILAGGVITLLVYLVLDVIIILLDPRVSYRGHH